MIKSDLDKGSLPKLSHLSRFFGVLWLTTGGGGGGGGRHRWGGGVGLYFFFWVVFFKLVVW